MNNNSVLKIQNLSVNYQSMAGIGLACSSIDLSIERGEVIGLVGESGCGKSTLGKTILNLLPGSAVIKEGEILFKGQNILSYTEKEINSNIRGNEISMIIQNPQNALNPVFKVGKQIIDVLRFNVENKTSSYKALKEKTIEMLEKMGIADPRYRFNEYPYQFSGGMKQRVMLSMAFICNPSFLIADEPTTALDVTIEAQILDLLRDVVKEYGTSVLYITHDLGIAYEIADRIAVMYAGSIVEKGPTERIFFSPAHPYTQALIHCLPGTDEAKPKSLKTIPGQVPRITELPRGCAFQARCDYSKKICCKSKPELSVISPGHLVACYNPIQKKERDE